MGIMKSSHFFIASTVCQKIGKFNMYRTPELGLKEWLEVAENLLEILIMCVIIYRVL